MSIMRMLLLLLLPLLLSGTLGPSDTSLRSIDSVLDAISASDLRLAEIGSRLTTANVALCPRRQPFTGLVVHALNSYAVEPRSALRNRYGIDGNIAVEAIMRYSVAADSGIRVGDSIVAINGRALGNAENGPPTPVALIKFHTMLADLSPEAPVRLDIRRRGQPLAFILTPKSTCRSRFELRVGPNFDASSDGETVQIGARFLAELDDNDLMVLISHELAHNILEHPQRLAASGAKGGLLAGFGRNAALFRQTETQADILSVSLVANAGFDPELVPKFWRSVGRRVFGSIFADSSHPSWRDRAATTEAEAKEVKRSSDRPHLPDIMKSRTQPLDGNWRAILIRDTT